MSNELKKKQIFLATFAVGIILVFGYGIYFVRSEVLTAQKKYKRVYRDLVAIEDKQKQADSLREELAKNGADIAAINSALIAPTYENKLALVIDIENAAKNLALTYELKIAGEQTAESIAEEEARLRRSRRGSSGQESTTEKKLPSIRFNITLSGEYPKIVRFINSLQSLPYYSKIESLNISEERLGEAGDGAVEANISFSVFTQ